MFIETYEDLEDFFTTHEVTLEEIMLAVKKAYTRPYVCRRFQETYRK